MKMGLSYIFRKWWYLYLDYLYNL